MIGRYITAPLASVEVPQAGQAHLWKVALSEMRVATDGTTLLNTDEQDRHRRFRHADDAHRFAARRIALRSILSAYLQCTSADIAFEAQDAAGKPMLARPHQNKVVFNTSSSADIALIAVAQGNAIGVDVEAARPVKDMDKIAKQFFTISENERWNALAPEQRGDAFYRLWTAKEALLKAVGTGLPGGLGRFEVSSDPAQPPALLRDAEGPSRFHLYAADPQKEYFGALAMDRPDIRIARFAFDPADAR